MRIEIEKVRRPRPVHVRKLASFLASDPRARRNVSVACGGMNDGAGSQAQRTMSGLLFAHLNGIRYVHLPFIKVALPMGDPQTWTWRWESFFNLGHGEEILSDHHVVVSIEDFLQDRRADEPVVVFTRQFTEAERTEQSFAPIVGELRRRYHYPDKSHLKIHRDDADEVVVAVHVRRGDIMAKPKQIAIRHTPDDELLATIRHIRESLPVSPRVNVYSEGDAHSFAAFREAGCDLHVSEDPFETFHNLVCADVLVTAKSSFSHVAAILSEGVVIHEPFWHQPMPDWIKRDSAGAFDPMKLNAGLFGASPKRHLVAM
jgi:hypothetical protein